MNDVTRSKITEFAALIFEHVVPNDFNLYGDV